MREGSGDSSVETWEALRSFGFEPDAGVVSDPPGGLSIQLGGLKLEAGVCINRQFQPILQISGVYSHSGTLAGVHIEMPREVESLEQAAAWVAWGLQRQASGSLVRDTSIEWLAMGRRNLDLLPWHRDRVAYDRRPQCSVERDWMRVALKKLRTELEGLGPSSRIWFGFDGEVLKIETPGGLIAVPGTGRRWPFRISARAEHLGWIPKRLSKPWVHLSYFQELLHIGYRSFPAQRETVLPP